MNEFITKPIDKTKLKKIMRDQNVIFQAEANWEYGSQNLL